MNVHERESDSFTLFTLLTAWIHLARVTEGHVRFIGDHQIRQISSRPVWFMLKA